MNSIPIPGKVHPESLRRHGIPAGNGGSAPPGWPRGDGNSKKGAKIPRIPSPVLEKFHSRSEGSPEKPNPLFYLLENPPRNSRILAPFRPLWNGQIPKKKTQTRPTPPRKIQGCPSLWMRRIPRKKGNHPEIFKYFINIRSWGGGKSGKLRKLGKWDRFSPSWSDKKWEQTGIGKGMSNIDSYSRGKPTGKGENPTGSSPNFLWESWKIQVGIAESP